MIEFMNFNSINKKGVAAQTLFFIMMLVVFAGILFFGFRGIFTVTDVVSESEIANVKSKVIDAIDFCEDGFNNGLKKIVVFDSSEKFDNVCILGNSRNSLINSDLNSEFEILRGNGDNIVLISGQDLNLDSSFVTFSFASEFDIGLNEDLCSYREANQIYLEFNC